MGTLLAAAAFFAGIHFFVSGTRLRDRLVSLLGERLYLALFSLVSIVGLAWLIHAYLAVRVPMPTILGEWRWLALLLNTLAMVFIAFGVLGASPTSVGGARALERPDAAQGLHRVTRHPFLWGVALWAAAHLLFNREPPHLVFFGTMLALGIFGPASIDRKLARRLGPAWERYAALTSNLPFAAILRGRNRLVWRELLSWKLLVGLALAAAITALHGRLFGMPALV